MYHLTYTKEELGDKLLEATDRFFKSDPWKGERDHRKEKFEKWLDRVCKAQRLPVPTLVISPVRGSGGGSYHPGKNLIELRDLNAFQLFYQFRRHVQHMAVMIFDIKAAREDAKAWASSLYYVSRPALFARKVKEGKIRVVEADMVEA